VVSSKRNIHGEYYGFVRFSKVRDVGKLLKAVNAIWFGNFRVNATVAQFDRSTEYVGNEEVVAKGEGDRGVNVEVKKLGEGEKKMRLGWHGVGGRSSEDESDDVGCVGEGGVRVGKMVVPVRGIKGNRVEGRAMVGDRRWEHVSGVGKQKECIQVPNVLVGTHQIKKLVRMYRSQYVDLKWARNGMVASVINGEAVPMVQNRIEDAGFTDLDIISMGADKVFIRSLSDLDVLKMVNEASDFFNLLFTNFVRWEKKVVPF